MRDSKQIEKEIQRTPPGDECRGDHLTQVHELAKSHDAEGRPYTAQAVREKLQRETARRTEPVRDRSFDEGGFYVP